MQLKPDNVKALYRLAQAQHSLKQYKQCIQSCSTALLFRPAAAQLHCLLQQATDALRLDFLATRHPDIEQALRQAAETAAQQVTELCLYLPNACTAVGAAPAECFNRLKLDWQASSTAQSVQMLVLHICVSFCCTNCYIVLCFTSTCC